MTSSSEEDSEEFIFTISNSQKQPTVTIQLGDIPVSLIVDSGSSVNLINNDTFKRLQSINQSIKLIPSKTKIFPYGTTTPIETKGQFDITICYKQHQTTATFHVTKSSPQGLLSYKTSSELGILTVEINNIATTNNVQPEIQALLEKNQPLFTGTGHLKNCEIHLEIDEAVTPVAQPARRIPHSLKQVVNTKLEEMRKQEIIEKVEGAT